MPAVADSLGAALPPGEEGVAVARPDQLVDDPIAAAGGQGDLQVREHVEAAMPEAERTTVDIGLPAPESPAWRPSDKFDALEDTVVEPVVDAPSPDTRLEAIGVVDIMSWMPVSVQDARSSQGEYVESTPAVASVLGTSVEDPSISAESDDAATDRVEDSASDAEAGADMVSQEITATLETSMPTLATPAFGALTVASGAEALASVSAEKGTTDVDPGDVWKWGEPATPAVPGSAIVVADGSQTMREPAASQETAEQTTSQVASPEMAKSLDQAKENEPWTTPPSKPHDQRGHAIGDALERVAKRIREGTIMLPADTSASNDEAALALALAALLRGRSD